LERLAARRRFSTVIAGRSANLESDQRAANRLREDHAMTKAPFDTALLDRLMEEAGIDLLLATSKHNIHYLLGGYRSLFFDVMDASGLSRYLPVLVYPKGRPDKAAFFSHRLDGHQQEIEPVWTSVAECKAAGSVDVMRQALAYVDRAGLPLRNVGVEMAFIPADAAMTVQAALPDGRLKDALFVLERLRARKTPEELALLRKASELVIDSMTAVIGAHGAGTSKQALSDALRQAEIARDMNFEYCLLTMGTSLNRAPSEQRWAEGDIVSLDSGGNYHGYIGDVCRMAILGEPDAELQDLLAEIETVQRAAFAAIRPGVMGAAIYAAAEPLVAASPNRAHLHFVAHGMGLISHEAPRLTATGPVPYDAYDAERPLEPGMVISVETTMPHPRRGFVKLEDTVAVTETGFEIFGEGARGWNRAGVA
jgi:Xaa-Pro aminopeptidase